MSAIIYVKSNSDDDLSSEQLELLHKFSDQARVWAYLLLKEAGMIGSTDEWRQKRQEWLTAKQELNTLNNSYGDAVNKALQLQYREKKESGQTPLPPAKEFFPPDTPPEELEKATKQAEKVKELFTSIYPSRVEVGWHGPFLTQDEQSDMLRAPDPELAEQWSEVTGLDPSKWSGGTGSAGSSPVLDLAKGFAVKKGKEVVDPKTGRAAFNPETGDVDQDVVDDFAHAVVMRAIRSYNPFKAEDTNTGSAGFEGQRASLGTYLFRAMENEIKSRKDAFARQADPSKGGIPLSLTQPLGGEESLSLEETVAERAKEENLFDFNEYYEPFRKWLEARVNKPGSKFTQESANRLLDIFKRIFIDCEKASDVARAYGLETSRPRAKEIAFLKKHQVDVSSLPATIPPTASKIEDAEKRQRLVTDFFRQLKEKAKSNPKAADELKEAQKEYLALSQPNAARIRNLIHGPFKGQTSGSVPYIMEFLMKQPEIAALVEETKKLKKQQALEEFLTSISTLRKEGGLNYTLLRNKIEQKLSSESPQLFKAYSYLYESNFSNPDTARMMKLSPPRITGLKKKIVSTLLDLPEIQNFFQETENGSISPLRRFIYNEGDPVKVMSINETGTITSTFNDKWYNIRLDNGNDVLTIKEDIQKYCTLVDSANNVLSHYYKRNVVSPQCYLSFIGGDSPKLILLELRPTDELKTTARLHINNNLVDTVEITEDLPDDMLAALRKHIDILAELETPFTPLFEEVE